VNAVVVSDENAHSKETLKLVVAVVLLQTA
jgi:hypothetical protein